MKLVKWWRPAPLLLAASGALAQVLQPFSTGTVTATGQAVSIVLPSPLRTTAATALNFACITTGSAVYINAQGYQAP